MKEIRYLLLQDIVRKLHELFTSNPLCKEIWPSYEEIKHIVERFDYYHNEYNIELYTNSEFFLKTMKQVENMELLDKEDIFGPATISQQMTCVYPNLIQKDGRYILYPMVAIFLDGKENFDKLNELFHEFYEEFPEYVYRKLNRDLVEKKDTELVRKYNNITARRDEILAAIREYSLRNKVTL